MKITNINIAKGQNKTINLPVAKLISGTNIDVPITIFRGLKNGPVLLLMAGLHGDEINSIDVIRQIIEKKHNHVDAGTVICIPIMNVFGFINFSREVPDGKDVNRSFPGFANGSLASQIAFHLTDKILPLCDYVIDFHTGGKSRFNIPQTRATMDNKACKDFAVAFNAPFSLHSNVIKKSLRETALSQGKTIIVYEGGESLRFDKYSTDIAINGIKNILSYLNMKPYSHTSNKTKVLLKRKWLRAPVSGFFHPLINVGESISLNQIVGSISGPYANYTEECVSKNSAYVITINNNPMVNRGDAIIQIAY